MSEHPARAAAQRSRELVQRKGPGAKEEWLALFADDAVIEDPIGPSPLDPEGKGHRGKDAIARFWDASIAHTDVSFVVHASYACGDEVANVMTITTRMAGGMTATVDGVFVYRVNPDGKLLSMRAYWEFDQMLATVGSSP